MHFLAAGGTLAGIKASPEVIVVLLTAGMGFYLKKQGLALWLIIAMLLLGVALAAVFPVLYADVNSFVSKLP